MRRDVYFNIFACFVFILQDTRLLTTLANKHGDNVDEKSLTICSGTDYININYLHVICPDAETAKVCDIIL